MRPIAIGVGPIDARLPHRHGGGERDHGGLATCRHTVKEWSSTAATGTDAARSPAKRLAVTGLQPSQDVYAQIKTVSLITQSRTSQDARVPLAPKTLQTLI